MVRIERLEIQGFKSFAKKTIMDFPTNFTVLAGPNGSGKCLRGDSKVILNDGRLIEIKELVERSLENSRKTDRISDGYITKDNPHDFKIFTLDPKTMKIYSKPVSAFIKRKSPKKLLKIKTKSGRELIVTQTHPFFVIKNGIFFPVQARKLRKKSHIAVPRILPINKNKLELEPLKGIQREDNLYAPWSFELVSKIKLYLKDQQMTKRELAELASVPHMALKSLLDGQAVNIFYLKNILETLSLDSSTYCTNIKSIRNKKYFKLPFYWSESLARFLGYMISEGRSSDTSNQLWFVNSDNALLKDFYASSEKSFGIIPVQYNYKPPSVDSIIYSRPLQKWLEKAFEFNIGSNSKTKQLPSGILSAPNNIVLNFLGALFDGDGYIHLKNRQAYFEYSTASKELAYGVATILLRFGFLPRIQKKLKHASNTTRKIKRPYYSVYLYGHSQTRRLIETIQFKNSEKIKTIKNIQQLEVKSNPNVDLIPGINSLIKLAIKLSGINVKKVGKICPKLRAYYENACLPSRNGLKEVIEAIRNYGNKRKEIESAIDYLQCLADSDIFWDEIAEIKVIKSKEKYVYDLSVDETHNFLAENFIVHNSNVIDGACFVLGRTSARSLRAERMLELIFNGGRNKKPAEFAKITLFFDNSDKRFPLEDKQIIISRKVNRRSISIYKLNGRTVTREKILEVLNAANIKPDGHNIILQGDVTEIIEMSPMERRQIIDEVSGIAEFDDKRNKAQRELLTVEERLREANIILNERSNLLQKLEQERKAADEYKKLTSEIDKLRASISKKKLLDAEGLMKNVDGKIGEREGFSGEVEKDLQQIENKLEEDEKSLESIGKRLFDRSKDIALIREAEKIRAEISRKKDKIESDKSEKERLLSIIERLKALQHTFENRAVQEVLKLGKKGVYGTIGSLSDVPEEYRTAIEVAAGSHLHDIVVDSENTAIECVNFLKNSKIGRATFLPLDKIKQRDHIPKPKEAGVRDFAINVVKFDRKYFNAFSFVFGDTLIVDKIETAKYVGIGKTRFVTLDGDLVERSGAIIGGFYRQEKKAFQESEEIKKYEQQIRAVEGEVQTFTQDMEKLKVQLEQLLGEEQQGSKELLELEKSREKITMDIESARARRKELYERRIMEQTELNKFKIQKARLEAELDNVKIEFENYKSMETYDLGIRVMEKKLKETLDMIQTLGPINMKAVEEYSQQQIVYQELKGRVDKLTEERDKIVSIITEIEGKRKETFFVTLNAVSELFKQVFNDLAGGEAKLFLEDPENLESGLILEASPAGKKLLNIDAMSGGEKTLTALAFLFAIQRYKPAPFYFLDEIDAALDKQNTKKMVELIKKYSDTAQFIVITHNDATITASDCVYGISMSGNESNIVGIKMPTQ